MLKTKVKASQITNLTDARYFAALEVEWLGFNLDKGSETFIEPQNAMAIKEWVEGPKIAGEFGLQDIATIRTYINEIGLDVVQLSHFSPVSDAIMLNEVDVIKAFVIENELDKDAISEHLFMFSDYVQGFLLKSNLKWSEVISTTANKEFFKDLCKRHPVILHFDFEPDDLSFLLSNIRPLGISVTGGEEEAVGVKSFDDLDDLFELLQIEI